MAPDAVEMDKFGGIDVSGKLSYFKRKIKCLVVKNVILKD